MKTVEQTQMTDNLTEDLLTLFNKIVVLVVNLSTETVANFTLIYDLNSMTSPIVLNVPTRTLLAEETQGSFFSMIGKFEY